jgi:hypothetical protein
MTDYSILEVLDKLILSIKNNPEDWEIEECRGYDKFKHKRKDNLYFLFSLEVNGMRWMNLNIKSSSFKIPRDYVDEITKAIKSFVTEKEEKRDQEIAKRKQENLKYALTIL